MDVKPNPNHQEYIRVLRAMTPEERVCKTFELSAFVKETLRSGIEQPRRVRQGHLHEWVTRLELCSWADMLGKLVKIRAKKTAPSQSHKGGAGNGSPYAAIIELFSAPSQELFDLLEHGTELARGLAAVA